MIAVLDTSVFVAGVFWRHEAHRVIRGWLRGILAPVISEAIFVEYERVLHEIKQKHEFDTDIELWLEAVRTSALWVTPVKLNRPVCRDPSDDKFVEAALASQAKLIIARDLDLCALQKPFGITILTPRAWLATLSRPQRRLLG